MSSVPSKTLYAVIIGINGYDTYPLKGCVNDALAIGAYFKKLCASQSAEGHPTHWEPQYLLHPSKETEDDLEAIQELGIDYIEPTRQNIINSFRHFHQATAQNDDLCLLYYSGHGSYMYVPEEFKEYEPSGRFETLVCSDSRRENGQDLIDKELGFLISEVLKDAPDLHFLTIMDSCHSGGNTRFEHEDIAFRRAPSGKKRLEAKDILGFNPNGNHYYRKILPGERSLVSGQIIHPRHISLSACRDTELANEETFERETIMVDGLYKEKKKRYGVFTYYLLQALEQGGTQISYQDLIQRVKIQVKQNAANQIPVLEVTGFSDQYQQFLNNQLLTPRPQYPVECKEHFDRQEWILGAGQMHGLPREQKGVEVKLEDGRIVKVKEVRGTTSILEEGQFSPADVEKGALVATLHQLGVQPLPFKLSQELTTAQIAAFQQAWSTHQATLPYLRYIIDPKKSVHHEVRLEGEAWMLTKKGNKIPMFRRNKQLAIFLNEMNRVGKWMHTLDIKNEYTPKQKEDIKVLVETLEGVAFGPKEFEYLANQPWENQEVNPKEITVRFSGHTQPAIKVKITNHNKDNKYFVGALYLNNQFGISHECLPPVELSADREFAYLTYSKRKFNAIPLMMDPYYHELGITEVTDYILIFVSESDFELSSFEQAPLRIDQKVKRSEGFLGGGEKEAESGANWWTILIPIHIIYPIPEQVLKDTPLVISRTFNKGKAYNVPTKSEVLSIEPPRDFKAKVQVTNRANVERLFQQTEKAGINLNKKALNPLADSWVNTAISEAVFVSNFNQDVASNLSIIELTDVVGEVDQGQPLKIIPGEPISKEEAILSYAYDEKSDLYLPCGLSDIEGTLMVTHLPDPTPTIIGNGDFQEQSDQSKNLKDSVKLFFKKIIWSKLTGREDYNDLHLVHRDEKGPIHKVTSSRKDLKDIAIVRDRLDLKANPKVLLLLHGWGGAPEEMEQCILEKTYIHQSYGAVLSFHYENLATEIEATAKDLANRLKALKLSDQSITVLGYNMGGLVARSLSLESSIQDKIEKIIQIGTPNAGIELAELRKKLFGWLTMAINGAAVLQPYLVFLTFFGRIIENKAFKTLQQLSPGSPYLTALNAKQVEGVPIILVAGKTKNIEANFEATDPVLAKIWKSLQSRANYLVADYFLDDHDNDMIVKVESMKALPNGHAQILELDCDHFNYFNQEDSLQKLVELLS